MKPSTNSEAKTHHTLFLQKRTHVQPGMALGTQDLSEKRTKQGLKIQSVNVYSTLKLRCRKGLTLIVAIVFSTIAYAQNWEPTGPFYTANGVPLSTWVHCIAADSQDPQTMYVGTIGGGIYKSVDSGNKWMPINEGLHDLRIVSIETTYSTLLAAGYYGDVFKSVNKGKTWEILNNELPQWQISEIVRDPNDSNTVYIAYKYSGILKSVDGGLHWTNIAESLNNRLISSIEINPDWPSTIYATATFQSGSGYGALYRSSDGGNTWVTLIDNKNILEVILDPENTQIVYVVLTNEGVWKSGDGGSTWQEGIFPINPIINYSATLTINPLKYNELFLGVASSSNNDVFMYKSQDTGLNWEPCANGLENCQSVLDLYINDEDPLILFSGTEKGLFKSVDGGESWFFSNDGIVSLHVYSLKQNVLEPSRWLAGTRKGIFSSSDNGESWMQIWPYGLAVLDIEFLPESNTIYCLVGRGSNSDAMWSSNDNGNTWSRVCWLFGPNDLVIDNTNPITLYVSDYEGVYKSLNGGSTWINISGNLEDTNILKLIKYSNQPSSIIGISENRVWRTVNDGAYWESLITPYPDTLIFNTLVQNPNNEAEYYIGTNQGLLKSEDFGETWTHLENLRHDITSVTFSPLNDNYIYVGTKLNGVFCSDNNGETWLQVGSNITLYTEILAISPDADYLLAGTIGNGIYKAEISEIVNINGVRPEKDLHVEVVPNPVNSYISIEYDIAERKEIQASVQIFNSVGAVVNEFTIKNNYDGRNSYTINTASFESGMYFLKFTIGETHSIQKIVVIK